MKDSDYIIIGDTEQFDGCLICVAGKTKERADEVLNRMLTNPTENDKRLMDGHGNLRIKEVPAEECWWRNEMQKSLTVPELVKLLNTESNKYGASGKPRELSLKVNGEYIGYVSSAKLDRWGDGLITDVCLELETE